MLMKDGIRISAIMETNRRLVNGIRTVDKKVVDIDNPDINKLAVTNLMYNNFKTIRDQFEKMEMDQDMKHNISIGEFPDILV